MCYLQRRRESEVVHVDVGERVQRVDVVDVSAHEVDPSVELSSGVITSSRGVEELLQVVHRQLPSDLLELDAK